MAASLSCSRPTSSTDDTHVVDADQLWLGEGHGFSSRARVNVSLALRTAAEVWPPLDRLQRQQVPDRMVLDGDELADLLEHGLEALDRAGIDVFWPRGLRGDLIPQARVEVSSGPREGPLMEGLFGPDAMFSFDWRLALGDDPLTDEEMAVLTGAKSPVIKLRDNWMIIDPVARPAGAQAHLDGRRRAQAADRTGHRTAGGADRHPLPRRRCARGPPRRDPGEGARPDRRRGRRVAPRHSPGSGGDAARLPAPRLHLARRADRRRAGRLSRRRHGPGQDDHPDRPAPAPSRSSARQRDRRSSCVPPA